MKSNLPKNDPDPTDDFFDSLQDNEQDTRVVPPLGIWQRFWHNTKLRITVGILMLLVILSGIAAYFLYSYQSSSQILTDYVPSSAWLYVEFNFDSNQWEQLQQKTPELASEINDFFIKQGLSQELINLSLRIALVGNLEEAEFTWTWLLKSSQPRQLETFLVSDTYMRQLSAQVAVISTHRQAIKSFNYRPGRPSATPQATSLWYGFVRPDELTDFYNDASERSITKPLLARWLQQSSKPVPLAIINHGEYVMLSLGTIAAAEATWPDFASDYDVVLKNINITKAITELESVLTQLPLAQFFWQSLKEESVANFALNWHALQDHLNQPATLAITNRQPWENFDSLEGLPLRFDELELILSLANNTPELEQFASDLMRRHMAYRFPSEVPRSLPDGSVAYDLIIDFEQHDFIPNPEKSGWQSIGNADGSLGYAMWSSNDLLTVVNQPEISTLRLAELRNTEYACGDLAGEQVYINHGLLNFMPWLQDFTEVLITATAGSLRVCLR